MLRGSPAVLGVFLCFMSLLMSTSSPSKSCPQSLINHVEQLRKLSCLQNCSDSTLYTPNNQNFKQRCPSSTLRCFAAELKVLTDELNVSGCTNVPTRIVGRLEAWSKRYEREKDCLQCELLEEKSVATFLSSLLSVLQNICSLSAS